MFGLGEGDNGFKNMIKRSFLIFFELLNINRWPGKAWTLERTWERYTNGLLTKCEVKIAGYWPNSFFCEFMDQGKVEVHKLAKNQQGQYPAILTEQTWSIKDLLYGFWWNFTFGIQRVVPSGQDGSIRRSILPVRVANHSVRFGSSCPLAELTI